MWWDSICIGVAWPPVGRNEGTRRVQAGGRLDRVSGYGGEDGSGYSRRDGARDRVLHIGMQRNLQKECEMRPRPGCISPCPG